MKENLDRILCITAASDILVAHVQHHLRKLCVTVGLEQTVASGTSFRLWVTQPKRWLNASVETAEDDESRCEEPGETNPNCQRGF